MNWLNYHHLYYFWVLGRAGSLQGASAELRLAPSTVSTQVKQLEESLGHELFDRSGRRLILNDAGRTVFDYAQDIFALGRELQHTLDTGVVGARADRLRVGIANAVPKLVTRRILQAVVDFDEPIQLICRQDRVERLLAELALHHLDVVLSDAPLPRNVGVKAYNHLLGSCDVLLNGHPELVARYRDGAPGNLNGAPFLLPYHDTAIRRGIDHWFEAHRVTPRIVGEFDDSALMNCFATGGLGLYPGRAIVRDDIHDRDGLETLLRMDGVVDRFYAITEERRLRHPVLMAIAQVAHDDIFSAPPPPVAA